MNGKRISSTLILGALIWAWGTSAAQAAPPWADLFTGRRMEADPNETYPVGEDNGPWMIMATSFSGDGAEQQARELVLELRKRYKLEAYTYRKRFEFGETNGRGIDPTGAPIRMHHRKDELKEVAVLVGNYSSVEDPDLQKTLHKLKYTRPECLKVSEASPTHQSLAGWRMTQKRVQEMLGSEKKEKGPMGHALVTTNPALPDDFFNRAGVDDLVLEMNKNVPHSLLDCKGKYTVQVATFKGHVEIDQRKIQEIKQGKKVESKLAEAARKAHELTEALRLKGWDAYEFHDHYASIVTVGSFDWSGTPRSDGRTELNPQILRIIETFGADPVNVPGQPGAAAVKSLVGIPFDVQPIPVQVPRRSIGREMARGKLF